MEWREPTQKEHELIVRYWKKELENNIKSGARTAGMGFCIIVLIPIIIGMIFTKFNSMLVIFFIIDVLLMFRISKISNINKYNLNRYNDFLNNKYKVSNAEAIDVLIGGRSIKRAVIKANIDGITIKEFYSFPIELARQYRRKEEYTFPILLIHFNENHPKATFYHELAIPLNDEGGNDEK